MSSFLSKSVLSKTTPTWSRNSRGTVPRRDATRRIVNALEFIDAQIRLLSVVGEQRIVIRAEIVRDAHSCNRFVEHATKRTLFIRLLLPFAFNVTIPSGIFRKSLAQPTVSWPTAIRNAVSTSRRRIRIDYAIGQRTKRHYENETSSDFASRRRLSVRGARRPTQTPVVNLSIWT